MVSTFSSLYGESIALLTDFYQLSMAYSHWQTKSHNKESVFHLFFRKAPFSGGYSIACGLNYAIDFLRNFRFSSTDLEYLASLKGNDSNKLFSSEFLEHLANLRFTCDLDAVPEGTIVYPYEPLLRIKGPIIQCQLFETILLNIYNFQTLIATKAARIKQSAGKSKIIEFGARRAQGLDGAVTGSWAAHVGGCDASSNVLAGKIFGIPVTGTHAHSWVMCFEEELEAFKAYAKAMPNNCVFLVDTYDTLNGTKHAIEAALWLKDNGYKFLGIRLDSGDLAYLSIEARKLLDEAGFTDAKIIASNDLDENIIESLIAQQAPIAAWGVGTKLITAYDQPALGCVYKLAAIRDSQNDNWNYRIKLSEQATKTSIPGFQQIRRFSLNNFFIADSIYDTGSNINPGSIIVDPLDMTRQKQIPKEATFEDLLKPIFHKGNLVYEMPKMKETKTFVSSQIEKLHPGIRRLLNPHQYPVGLELGLHELRTKLILKARGIK